MSTSFRGSTDRPSRPTFRRPPWEREPHAVGAQEHLAPRRGRRAAWYAPGLWATASALAGFAVVRSLGLILAAGPATRPIFVALVLEVSGFAISALTLRHLRRAAASAP